MEIIGTDLSQKELKNKKMMKTILIICIILVMAIVAIIGVMYYLNVSDMKVLIDQKELTEYAQDLIVVQDGKTYISIKDIAKLVNYNVYNGEYNKYQEDDFDKCYVQNSYEAASFELGSNKIYKIALNNNENNDYEYFDIEEPVIKINNKLYTTIEGISKACNIVFNNSKSGISIYTLPYLVNSYTTSIPDANLTSFNNQKALLYNRIVRGLKDTTTSTTQYGVYTLSGEEIIGIRYKDVEFIESSQEFTVTTHENKMGIVTITGTTKIAPQYDDLKQIDKDLGLYLATDNNKKGVLEKGGKILIYLEYDEIGINTKDFESSNIKNPYLLFDNCIPVKQNGKWGMFDKTGKLILPIEYDELGCRPNSSSKNVNSVLVIPEIKCIVVCKEIKENNGYGIVNYLGKEVLPIVLSSVYSITFAGRETYTMINAGNSFNVIEYIQTYRNIDELNRES